MYSAPSSPVAADATSVAVLSIHTMAEGDRAAFDPLYLPSAVDRENRLQPPSSRVPGPASFYSTALWLRAAFEGLHYDIHHTVADGKPGRDQLHDERASHGPVDRLRRGRRGGKPALTTPPLHLPFHDHG